MTTYREILKFAWQITIRNKLLWFFGIFASFISLETIYDIVLSQISKADTQVLYGNLLSIYNNQILFLNLHLTGLNLLRFDLIQYLYFIVLGALILLFVWLAFISQIFIINACASIYRKNQLTPQTNFNRSDNKFLAVVGLNIVCKLLLYVGYLLLTLPILYALLNQNQTALTYADWLYLILFTIFAVIVNFISAYATNFIVLHNYHILESLSAAWKLFRKNIAISLEMAFILYFLKVISFIVIICFFLFFLVPLCILLLITLSLNDLIGLVMTATLIILSFLLIALFVNSFFTIFYLSSWTITFIKLSEETIGGKITAFIHNIPGLISAFAQKNNIHLNKKTLKKQSRLITLKAEKEAIVLAGKIATTYRQNEPNIKKQGKKLIKKIKQTYNQLEPKLEKEIKKSIRSLRQKPRTTKRTVK